MSTTIPGFVPGTATGTSGAASTGTTSANTTSPAAQTGLGGMTASDFLNLMIQQLQQQDPLNPTDSNQLLTQMSQISTLQSNTQMEQSLSGLTLQQSIGAGGNLMGKTVTGLDGTGNMQSGVVTAVQVADNQVNLQLNNGSVLALGNVTAITNTPLGNANGSTGSSAALSNLAQALAALGA